MDEAKLPAQSESPELIDTPAATSATLAAEADTIDDAPNENIGPADALTKIRRRIEVTGDLLLMTIILAFFVYLWLDAPHWSHADQELPRVIVVAGVLVWLVRVATLLGLKLPQRLARKKRASNSGLMDIGFGASDNPRQTALRLVGAWVYIGALLLGINVFGFKVALPILTGGYILVMGKAKWYWALLVAVLFEAAMILVLDELVFVPWPVPLLNHVLPGYCPNGC